MLDGDFMVRQREYTKLFFGEFVESICRMTLMKFEDCEMQHLALGVKLKYTLENVFRELVQEEVKVPLPVFDDAGDEGQDAE